MGKQAGEAGVEMITNLVNQNIVEEFIPAEWEHSTIERCFRRGNYKTLKLTDQILKIQRVRGEVDKTTGGNWWDGKIE